MTFTVEDNGVGISDADLARVGEPYFQARASYDRRHGGTGLGLSIVKGLVHLHGGDISIRSRFGEGTRVSVRLPLDCERTLPAKLPPAPVLDVTRYLAAPPPVEPSSSISERDDVIAPLDIRVKKSA
jgi:cell cycle sensor histidine kinase DivJ